MAACGTEGGAVIMLTKCHIMLETNSCDKIIQGNTNNIVRDITVPRDKCIAAQGLSTVKLPGRPWIMSAEGSGEAVCNGDPTVQIWTISCNSRICEGMR